MRGAVEQSPLVLEIKGNSLDDGPGIRSVIFLKGCPLSCSWCHNPESKKVGPEIAFDQKNCVGCGTCQTVCPEKALSPENPAYIDRTLCSLCFSCVDVCPSAALSRVGKPMGIPDILSAIVPDKPFFDASGGGVTLSGGEATLFMDFLSDLLQALKKQNIHTLIETCGHFDIDRFLSLIFPYTDEIYFDLKLMDAALHQKHCGIGNQRILKNLTRLAKEKNKELFILPRTPLIPGITDTEANIREIAAFLKGLDFCKAALLPYNPLWQEKSVTLGTLNCHTENPDLATFSDPLVLERCRALFADAGIET